MDPWRYSTGGISIALRVTPRGGRDDIDGIETLANGRSVVKVRVRAIAEGGEANRAVTELLAKALGVPKARVLHTAESLFHDHVPAKRFGLATCRVNRRAGKGSFGATRAPDESVTPDWQVTSLGALADLHRREGGG